MRLIDADALMELIKDTDSYRYGYIDADDIQDAPTIDAVPVVHGKWIDGMFEPYCSECDADALNNVYGQSVRSRYCPHCGTKMDLEG